MTGGCPSRCISSPISRPQTSKAMIWNKKVASDAPCDPPSAANTETETRQRGTAASNARKAAMRPPFRRPCLSSACIRLCDLMLANLAPMLTTSRYGRGSDGTPQSAARQAEAISRTVVPIGGWLAAFCAAMSAKNKGVPPFSGSYMRPAQALSSIHGLAPSCRRLRIASSSSRYFPGADHERAHDP